MYGVQLYAVVCVCTVLSQSGLKDLSCTLELVLEAVLLAHPSFCTDAPSQQEINLSDLFLCVQYVLCLILPRLCHCLVAYLVSVSYLSSLEKKRGFIWPSHMWRSGLEQEL